MQWHRVPYGLRTLTVVSRLSQPRKSGRRATPRSNSTYKRSLFSPFGLGWDCAEMDDVLAIADIPFVVPKLGEWTITHQDRARAGAMAGTPGVGIIGISAEGG